MKMALDAPLWPKIYYVMWKFFYPWCVSFTCWKLSISWWSLHNFTMSLFVTLWQQWKFVKLISKSCIFILVFHNDGLGDFMGWCKPTMMKCMKWVTNLNIRINHLGFELNGQHVWAKHKNMETIVNVLWPMIFILLLWQGEGEKFNYWWAIN
jgi:hypothetical protein